MMARAGEWEDVAFRRMGGSRGVRQDLSEVTRALARQLCVVADFLAPPPPPSKRPPPPPPSSSPAAGLATAPSAPASSRAMVGVRSDLAEIGGGFKTGFAALSCLLRNSAEKDGGGAAGKVGSEGSRVLGAVGVTKEVLEFVEFLSARPEEWVQCPVPLDSHFEMTDVRRKHITAVEHLVPSLAALKVRLCPSQINEGTFWKIYLFLLHPKLSEHDCELLSTPQIVEEMDRALQELRNRIIKRLENSMADASSLATGVRRGEIEEVDEQMPGEGWANSETAASLVNVREKEAAEHWLEDIEFLTYDVRKQLESEEEVFLSDLENDDLPRLKRCTSSSSLEVIPVSPPGSSSEWIPLASRSGLPPRSSRPVQPRRHEQKADGESSDWVDAGDSDSTLG